MFNMKANRPPTLAEAEGIAALALLFVVSDDERFEQFCQSSGLAPDDLKAAAREPHVLAAVFDHLMQHEPWIAAFAAEHTLSAEQLGHVAHLLAGRTGGAASREQSSSRTRAPSGRTRFPDLYKQR